MNYVLCLVFRFSLRLIEREATHGGSRYPFSMMRRLQLYFLFVSLVLGDGVTCFQSPISHHRRVIVTSMNAADSSSSSSSSITTDELKAELSAYLIKREEANADDVAKSEVGKIIGGTRGNVVLEYVSGSPNKSRIQENIPEIFDYDELIKYGYSHLVTPIMEEYGGRRAMYTLMDLPEPATTTRSSSKKSVPKKLIIDRTGESDKARYTGLKISSILDEDVMGKALEEAARKVKEGQSLRKRLVEEDYVMPYADNTNKGPRQTPLWTPEKLDEAGKKAGLAQAWARKARMGSLKKDPYEELSIEGELRIYSVLSTMIVCLAYGNSTPRAFEMMGLLSSSPSNGDLNIVKIVALGVIVAGLGSAVVNGVALAPPRRRSSFVWSMKGLFGGPLAVIQLRILDELKTNEEIEG